MSIQTLQNESSFHVEMQYKYEPNEDLLLKSEDGRKWFYNINNKFDRKPIYSDYEYKVLTEERKLYEEFQEQWEQNYMEMQDDPAYWESQYYMYFDFLSNEELAIVGELAGFVNGKFNKEFDKEKEIQRKLGILKKEFKDKYTDEEYLYIANKSYELMKKNDKKESQYMLLQFMDSFDKERGKLLFKDSKLELEENKNEDISFPINALPYGIKDIVEEATNAFEVDCEFFALPTLVAAATAIGSKFEVALNDTLSTKPIIYACLVAGAGSGKSPAQSIAMKPIKDIQDQAYKQYYKDLEQYEVELENYELKKKLYKKENTEIDFEQPMKPKLKEYYTTNSTIEAIANILNKNKNGIVYIVDEFEGFYNSLNSYRSGKGSDLQEWLTLWNGDSLKINRKGQEIPIIVPNTYVSIIGNMTPSAISKIAQDSNTENGFLDRFLFAYPKKSKEFKPHKAKGINPTIEEKYHNLIKGLLNKESNDDNKYIKLSDEARNIYDEYFDKTSEIAGEDEKLRSIITKIRMYLVRFALIIHLCEQQQSVFVKYETIQKESMEKAVKLCEYFRLQADSIYEKLSMSQYDEMVERAINVIKKKAVQENNTYIIKKRDIQRGIKGLKADEMNILAQELIKKEIIKLKEEGKQGSVTYYVNNNLM